MSIVLVHGAWTGAWTWKDAAQLLRSWGYQVYVPTLTGLAERSHVPPEAVGLTAHVADVAGLMRYEDLNEVLLVGHSYGGMVITGAADIETDRVAGMVYFDAVVPESGQSFHDIMPADLMQAQLERAEAFDGGNSLPHPHADGIPPGIAGSDKFNHLFTTQPIRTLQEPWVSVRAEATWPPRRYVLCRDYVGSTFQTIAARVKHEPDWTYEELPALHDVVRTNPAMTADTIRRAAESLSIPKIRPEPTVSEHIDEGIGRQHTPNEEPNTHD